METNVPVVKLTMTSSLITIALWFITITLLQQLRSNIVIFLALIVWFIICNITIFLITNAKLSAMTDNRIYQTKYQIYALIVHSKKRH